MNRPLLVGCLLLVGCDRLMPQPMWSDATTPQSVAVKSQQHPLNVITAGQSNMTLRINGTDGIPTYFRDDMKQHGIAVSEINVAVGNTPIETWAPGGSGYYAMVQAGKSQGHTDLLLFWQGEDEARSNDMARATAWGQSITQMVLQLRQDLNQPDLKVIFCQIGPEPTVGAPYTTWSVVKAQQESIFLPNVKMTKTDDQDFGGWLHTEESGYKVIAGRMVSIFCGWNL